MSNTQTWTVLDNSTHEIRDINIGFKILKSCGDELQVLCPLCMNAYVSADCIEVEHYVSNDKHPKHACRLKIKYTEFISNDDGYGCSWYHVAKRDT